MKNIIAILTVLFLFSTSAFSQTVINEYSFVVVPEQYGFLSEKNQFQLNSMSMFYFEKYGLNPFYMKDLPDVSNCDGLWAEADLHGGLTATWITIILKNCKGVEITKFTGARSKYKEYKKAYQDALRKTFEEIRYHKLNQPDPLINSSKKEKLSAQIVTIEKPTVLSVSGFYVGPENKFNTYTSATDSFLLKKTNTGYMLYQESVDSESGLLLIGKIVNVGASYVCTISGMQYPATFTATKDLKIKKETDTMIFKFQN